MLFWTCTIILCLNPVHFYVLHYFLEQIMFLKQNITHHRTVNGRSLTRLTYTLFSFCLQTLNADSLQCLQQIRISFRFPLNPYNCNNTNNNADTLLPDMSGGCKTPLGDLLGCIHPRELRTITEMQTDPLANTPSKTYITFFFPN